MRHFGWINIKYVPTVERLIVINAEMRRRKNNNRPPYKIIFTMAVHLRKFQIEKEAMSLIHRIDDQENFITYLYSNRSKEKRIDWWIVKMKFKTTLRSSIFRSKVTNNPLYHFLAF